MLYLGIVPSQLHCIPNQFDDDAVFDLTCNEDRAKEITTFEYLPTGNLRQRRSSCPPNPPIGGGQANFGGPS